MMEREFELRRTQEVEHRHRVNRDKAYPATQDNRTMSSDTGEVGQSVLQPEHHLGHGIGDSEPTGNPATATSQYQNTVEQLTDTVGVGANQQEPIPDTADLVTGWEEERAFFFSPQAEIAANQLDGFALDTHQLATIDSDIVSLGRSVESLTQSTPVRDSTSRPAVKEHKKGVGQKQDDHSGYDFEMKM